MDLSRQPLQLQMGTEYFPGGKLVSSLYGNIKEETIAKNFNHICHDNVKLDCIAMPTTITTPQGVPLFSYRLLYILRESASSGIPQIYLLGLVIFNLGQRQTDILRVPGQGQKAQDLLGTQITELAWNPNIYKGALLSISPCPCLKIFCRGPSLGAFFIRGTVAHKEGKEFPSSGAPVYGLDSSNRLTSLLQSFWDKTIHPGALIICNFLIVLMLLAMVL